MFQKKSKFQQKRVSFNKKEKVSTKKRKFQQKRESFNKKEKVSKKKE